MKVLVVSSHYERPGSYTGHPVHRLSRELVGCGIELRVLCPVPRLRRGVSPRVLRSLLSADRSLILDGVSVTYTPYLNIPHLLSPRADAHRLARSLRHSLRTARWYPDVIHAHRLFPTADAALHLARWLNCPLIATAHGSDVHTHPLQSARIMQRVRIVVEGADIVTAVSRDLTRRIHEMATPRLRATTVYLGVDTARFQPVADKAGLREQLDLPIRGPGFISVCRLHHRKGVFDLLESFVKVKESLPAAWLVYLGDGPEREELQRRAADAGIQESVLLPGARHNQEVPQWLAAADVFVLASHAEGLPNVVLEAMAVGLPVVASDVGGTGEALVDGTGLLFNPGDTRALAEMMTMLARETDRRTVLGAAALDRAREHFSWEGAARHYAGLYTEATGLRPSGEDRPA